MRYCVIPKGLTLTQIEAEVKKCGGTDIKAAPWSEMLFAELDSEALSKLQVIPGLAIKNIGKTKTTVLPPPTPLRTTTSVYAGNLTTALSRWAAYHFRNSSLDGKQHNGDTRLNRRKPMSKVPAKDPSKSLIPTKDDIGEILSQVSEAQKKKPDLMSLPTAILQAWVGCIVQKAFNRLEGERDEAANQLKDEVVKTAEQFGNEIDKAIKRFEDEINR